MESGIIYNNGKIFLIGDENPSNETTFLILKRFSKLLSIILSKVEKNDRASIEEPLRKIFYDSYLSIMAGGDSWKEIKNFVKEKIEEDNFFFEFFEDSMRISNLPKSIASLLYTILYCMITLFFNLRGDINYVLRATDIL